MVIDHHSIKPQDSILDLPSLVGCSMRMHQQDTPALKNFSHKISLSFFFFFASNLTTP